MADDDKELTSEEKAALIGKDDKANGHDKDVDNGEPVPDYEVTEEGDEALPKEEEGDKRLGKSREDRDRAHLSNREKRQLRKKRIAEKFDAKDALIKQQQEQLNALAGRLNEVDGRLSQVDHQTLVQTYNESVAAFQEAERKHKEAFSSGDGEKATVAMREMYTAQRRIDECEAINARNQQQPQRQQQAPQKDMVVVTKAKEWSANNPWFKAIGAPGRDEDSAITDAVAKRLVEEGFDARTDDYWDELSDRLAARGIGDDDQQDQSQSQRERQETPKAPERRKSPPVGGGNGRGDIAPGKVAVSLPTKFIDALKEAGIWQDKVRRNRAILNHQRIVAEGKR